MLGFFPILSSVPIINRIGTYVEIQSKGFSVYVRINSCKNWYETAAFEFLIWVGIKMHMSHEMIPK